MDAPHLAFEADLDMEDPSQVILLCLGKVHIHVHAWDGGSQRQ